VFRGTPLTNAKALNEVVMEVKDTIAQKIVSLPGNPDRVFMIGGQQDMSGANTTNQCFEIING
jgi:hypothetical protein